MNTSVCIPTYNGSAFIEESIRSILNQSHEDFELVIVDDCSTDATVSIIETFDDKRISFHQNPKRLGLPANWNRCLQLARGKYVYIFHQDDVMLPDNLASKVQVLDENPHVGFVYSQALRVDENGDVTGDYWVQGDNSDFLYKQGELFEKLVSGEDVVCCPSVLARSDCYKRLGPFNETLLYTCDWEMWMRVSLFYDVAYLSEPLIAYRWHSSNTTQQFGWTVAGLDEELRAKLSVLSGYPLHIPNGPAIRNKVKRYISAKALNKAYTQYYQHDYTEAKRSLRFALRVSPHLAGSRRAILMASRLILGEHGTRVAKSVRNRLTGSH